MVKRSYCRKTSERVLTADPGMGVVRHIDAGYERAVEVARERRVADDGE
ncbi:MAG TPA: hypothetical protein VF434_11875 [Promineifilum sp.]